MCSVIALTAAGEIGTLRLGIVAAACLLLPGMGWASKLRLGDAGDRLALAIAISISALTVVGTTMVVLGRWSTPLGLVALAAVGAIGFLPRRLLAPVSARLSSLRIATLRKPKKTRSVRLTPRGPRQLRLIVPPTMKQAFGLFLVRLGEASSTPPARRQ
jgi:hypothetical protein